MTKKTFNWSLALLLIFSFANIACEPGTVTGIDGMNSLANITNEPVGTNCENGGLKVDVGLDTNTNGELDESEILSTGYVCNGADGISSLTNVSSESAGENCSTGGIRIDSGLDSDKNGTLEETEISASVYVCNGSEGNSSLTKITSEAAGDNCSNGGLKIDSGLDDNKNGILDTDEITSTSYVCNGINGTDGKNLLLKTSNESPGENCQYGGLKVISGLDTNSNGILDEDEISSSVFVCNGAKGDQGNDGLISLTKTASEAAGENCESGGIKIQTGIDSDTNGVLQESEVTSTKYICNGTNGSISLVKTSAESSGLYCETGGVKIESGVDQNGNLSLDDNEIESTEYVCNGYNASLDKEVKIEFPGSGYAYATSDTSGFIYSQVTINNFNISSYSEIDSVAFMSYLQTSDSTATSIIELYDTTNDSVIAETMLSSNSLNSWEWQSTTINFLDNIPTSVISLGIRVRTSIQGKNVSFYLPELRLYRD